MNYLHPEGELNINTFVMRVVHTFLLSIFRATAVLCIYTRTKTIYCSFETDFVEL